LPRATQSQIGEANADDLGVGHLDGAIFGEQGHGAGLGAAVFEDLDGLLPSGLLLVVDLSQVENVPLHDPAAGAAFVFDHAPVAVFLAIFLSRFAAQKHNGIRLCT
jgi:hypothetical protein